MMANTIYILCAATSIACAVLLTRGWMKSRTQFLLWCALCFICLALNNGMLFVDQVIYPNETLMYFGVELRVLRAFVAILGYGFLLWGLIWDLESRRAQRHVAPEGH